MRSTSRQQPPVMSSEGLYHTARLPERCRRSGSRFFIAVRKELYYNTENQKQLGMMSMTKILEFLKKQPLVIGYAVQIVISGIITLMVWKKVGKTINFEEIRENW